MDSESNKKELAKDVCAIANSKGGRGYLVIGIHDKTKIVEGIENDKLLTEEQLQQVISSRCEPPIPISIDNFILEGKTIAVITIYDGGQKPYQIRENGAFYIRRGSTTDTMRKQELVSALQENLNLSIETCPIVNGSIESINYEIVDKYFELKGIKVTDENRFFLMENASIIVRDREGYKYNPSLGGLLVFSDINSVYIPHNMVRIVNKISSKLKPIYIIQGNLMQMIDKSTELIKEILPLPYPNAAIIEGIKNAVLYRDYTAFYKEIEVVITENSISVISPGNLFKEVNNPSKDIKYFKRNMWIYEKMITLDMESRFLQSGRGFNIMEKSFRNHGKVKFINCYADNIFKVIYPGIKEFYKC